MRCFDVELCEIKVKEEIKGSKFVIILTGGDIEMKNKKMWKEHMADIIDGFITEEMEDDFWTIARDFMQHHFPRLFQVRKL